MTELTALGCGAPVDGIAPGRGFPAGDEALDIAGAASAADGRSSI